MNLVNNAPPGIAILCIKNAAKKNLARIAGLDLIM